MWLKMYRILWNLYWNIFHYHIKTIKTFCMLMRSHHIHRDTIIPLNFLFTPSFNRLFYTHIWTHIFRCTYWLIYIHTFVLRQPRIQDYTIKLTNVNLWWRLKSPGTKMHFSINILLLLNELMVLIGMVD